MVRDLTTQDLRKFYHARLGADETVLVVIGDIDPDEVLEAVGELFAEMPATAEVPFVIRQPDPVEARTLVARTNKPLAAVQIGYGPAGTRTDEDYPAMQVLVRVLSSFPTGWLESELRGDGEGLVYAVGAGYMTGLVPGYTAVLFNTQPSQADEATQRAMAVVERIRESLVDDATLNRARARVMTAEFFGKQTNSDRAAEAALGELYGMGIDGSQQFMDAVRALDAEALREVARHRLRDAVVVTITQDPSLMAAPVGAE